MAHLLGKLTQETLKSANHCLDVVAVKNIFNQYRKYLLAVWELLG